MEDVQSLVELMLLIEKETEGIVRKYIIDANASWSPHNCETFLTSIENYKNVKDKILYLEQPFPIVMSEQ
jgi:L-alanine-DL-glutamate epimerase-like enolase superfamily enzyme